MLKDLPAFPRPCSTDSGDIRFRRAAQSGMTLRQHYAGLAMMGLLARPGEWLSYERCAEEALKHTDALIAQLEK